MGKVDFELYDKDFYSWAIRTAYLIRNGRLDEIDLENVAEEIESMGNSNKRELISRFSVLLAHLLKWKFQPERRNRSWRNTIEEQRDEVIELIEDSPSLKHELDLKLIRSYRRAVLIASTQTGISKVDFPKICPFSLNELIDIDFFPE